MLLESKSALWLLPEGGELPYKSKGDDHHKELFKMNLFLKSTRMLFCGCGSNKICTPKKYISLLLRQKWK